MDIDVIKQPNPSIIDTRPFTNGQVFEALDFLAKVCSYYQEANFKLGQTNRCEGCPLRGKYDNECAIAEQYYQDEVKTIEEWSFRPPGAPYKAFD